MFNNFKLRTFKNALLLRLFGFGILFCFPFASSDPLLRNLVPCVGFSLISIGYYLTITHSIKTNVSYWMPWSLETRSKEPFAYWLGVSGRFLGFLFTLFIAAVFLSGVIRYVAV